MAARKNRPVLYEVFRSRSKTRDPAFKPRSQRLSVSVERLSPTVEHDPRESEGSTFARTPATPGHVDRFQLTISGQTLAILIAVIVVLLVLAFSAGQRFATAPIGAEDASQPPEPSGTQSATDTPDDSLGMDESVASDHGSGGEASEIPSSLSGSATATEAEQQANRDQPRRVTLQKGYHYIIVQHFGKRRDDALATARFLQEHGVPCATLPGGDIRVVATQPFLFKQSDSGAARRERRAADELLRRIRQIGRDFDEQRRKQGKGGYTLSGCYLLEIR